MLPLSKISRVNLVKELRASCGSDHCHNTFGVALEQDPVTGLDEWYVLLKIVRKAYLAIRRLEPQFTTFNAHGFKSEPKDEVMKPPSVPNHKPIAIE
jgi:hypothetical protein